MDKKEEGMTEEITAQDIIKLRQEQANKEKAIKKTWVSPEIVIPLNKVQWGFIVDALRREAVHLHNSGYKEAAAIESEMAELIEKHISAFPTLINKQGEGM